VDFADGNWVITDLNSRNGTMVNGVSITRWTLRAGDQVQIGDAVLVFQAG
jgi:pSer/pThr/pTyr-binding forkhead associated (FHA) protein